MMDGTDLFERSKAGEAFLIRDYADDVLVVSICAEIFKTNLGLAFADLGWCGPDVAWHPFHLIRGGEVLGTGPWQCGDALIYPITPDMPERRSWEAWVGIKQDNKYCTRARALEQMKVSFFDVEIFD